MTTIVLPFEVNGVALTIDYVIEPTTNASEFAVTARVNLTPDEASKRIIFSGACSSWRENNGEALSIEINEELNCRWTYGSVTLEFIVGMVRKNKYQSPKLEYTVRMYDIDACMTYMLLQCSDYLIDGSSLVSTKTKVTPATEDTITHLSAMFKGSVVITTRNDDEVAL